MKTIEHANREKTQSMIRSTVGVFMKHFPEGKVVDLGTRTGYAVELLSKAGYDAIGVEINPYYVDYAQEQGLPVIVDNILNSRLPDDTFDLIYSRHVLEHCADTVKFFETCERILKLSGSVFVTFPTQKAETFKAKPKDHKVFYETIDDFKKVLKKVNFSITHLDYSEKSGILPLKREILFIGKVKK